MEMTEPSLWSAFYSEIKIVAFYAIKIGIGFPCSVPGFISWQHLRAAVGKSPAWLSQIFVKTG